MTQTAQDDSFYVDDPRILEFSITDAATSGPLNLAGKSITWKMMELDRYNKPTTTAILNKSTASGVAVTNSTGGILQVTLSSTETASLLGNKFKKTFYHQLEINDVITATGRLTMFKSV